MPRSCVASSGPGGTFHVEMNGVNVTGPITIPDTGDWQAWRTLTAPATFTAGTQILRLVMDSVRGGAVGNFDSIGVTRR